MATFSTRNEEEAQDLQNKGRHLLTVKGAGLEREYIFAEGKMDTVEKLVEPAPEKPKSRRGRRRKK